MVGFSTVVIIHRCNNNTTIEKPTIQVLYKLYYIIVQLAYKKNNSNQYYLTKLLWLFISRLWYDTLENAFTLSNYLLNSLVPSRQPYIRVSCVPISLSWYLSIFILISKVKTVWPQSVSKYGYIYVPTTFNGKCRLAVYSIFGLPVFFLFAKKKN